MNAHRWKVLAVLALVQFTIVADATIVNVALPDIARDLGLSELGLTWVVNAYLLAAGGLLLLGGRIADLVGRRRTFLTGAILLGIASVGCALSQDGTMLVLSRTLQGVGEALASPAALSLIATLFPERDERAKALGIWGGLAGLGAVAGVTLSGLLVTFLGWPFVFWINVPVVVVAVVLLPRWLGADAPREAGPLDLVGAALLTAGSLMLLQGLTLLAREETSGTVRLVTLVGGCALLVAFAAWERVVPHPLIPRTFFRSPPRVVANLLSMLVVGPMSALFLILTLYQQIELGRSALQTGLSYVPFCLVFLVGIALSVTLMSRIGVSRTVVVAFGLAAIGSFLLALRLPADAFTLESLPWMVLLALGFGMAMPPLQNAAMADLPEDSVGLGAGVQTAVQALANAVGVALSVVVALLVRQHAWTGGVAWPEPGTSVPLAAGGVVLVAGLLGAALHLRMPREAQVEPVVSRA